MAWDTYRSDNSAQASISVGDDPRNSTRVVIASSGVSRLCKSAIERFNIG